jgi:starch phosphorylase
LYAPPLPIPQPRPLALDAAAIRESFAFRMMYSVAKDGFTASPYDLYHGLAYAVRDRVVERWFRTQNAYYRADVKRVYYLSLEFLMGRALLNNVINLGALPAYREAISGLGYDLDRLQEEEPDAGLGNGGLGRLAACFLDSAATLGLPFYGYGIRYDYGIFQQRIIDGYQVEAPDHWLRLGNPWEIPRPSVLLPVKFYGTTRQRRDELGQLQVEWVDTQTVYAMAYDTPILGYANDTVNSLRLWAARSSQEFDLARFNRGDYVRAVEDKNLSENISKVLYPPDDQEGGKELRLKQQYFFVSATLQDVIRRFKKREGRTWALFPEKAILQLNDTHPALAIPELMRVLVDQEHLGWDEAWALTQRSIAYTNHTVLAEALEKWPVGLLQRLLPRHFEIIQEIDRRARQAVRVRFPADPAREQRMAILDDGRVHMAHLAVTGSSSVNGVAKLHSEILKSRTFADFHELYPDRINNKTNGITPRRWLLRSNPRLAALLTEAIGDRFVRELEELRALGPLAEDAGFRQRWALVKRANKEDLARFVEGKLGLRLDPDLIFDCQVKRIHEYKRQLLNALHVLHLYHRIRDGEDTGPGRAVLFAGKAAPGYAMAKLVIKFICSIAGLVNADPKMKGRLAVAFLPNYSVSLAERLMPACEISEQISTAGTEASGTGNMKAALNGALTMGTLDGANVEIREEVGEENLFIFGHTAPQVAELTAAGYDPQVFIAKSPDLQRVLATISTGALAVAHPGLFDPILRTLQERDGYLHCADFDLYRDAQRRAVATYRDAAAWNAMSIRNVAGMGRFSSDRTVREYAEEIWGVEPVHPPKADRS